MGEHRNISEFPRRLSSSDKRSNPIDNKWKRQYSEHTDNHKHGMQITSGAWQMLHSDAEAPVQRKLESFISGGEKFE